MNWLQRLFGLDRPGPMDVDPDNVVHIATLPLWQAPLIVIGLQEQGIRATFAEMTSPKVALSGRITARLFVLERDRLTAEEIIAELTAD